MAGETRLPSEDELRHLPRWARVALAARCARRVYVLVKHFWPTIQPIHQRALEVAIQVAEQAAARGVARAATVRAAARARAATTVAAVEAYSAAHAAACVVFAAARAARAARAPDATRAAATASADAVVATYDAYLATYTARGTSECAHTDARNAVRADFSRLQTLARRHKWTHYTPVPPTVFGPLWPNGAPACWPGEWLTPILATDEYLRAAARQFVLAEDAGIDNVLDGLPASHRTAFALLFREGVTPEEIARQLALDETDARQLLWQVTEAVLAALVKNNKRFVLRIDLPELYSPAVARDVEDATNELVRTLNEAHIARGAGRLSIDDIKTLVVALVPEEV